MHGRVPSMSLMCPTWCIYPSLHLRNGCCTSAHSQHDRPNPRCLALHGPHPSAHPGSAFSAFQHGPHSLRLLALWPHVKLYPIMTLTTSVDHCNPAHIFPNQCDALMHRGPRRPGKLTLHGAPPTLPSTHPSRLITWPSPLCACQHGPYPSARPSWAFAPWRITVWPTPLGALVPTIALTTGIW